MTTAAEWAQEQDLKAGDTVLCVRPDGKHARTEIEYEILVIGEEEVFVRGKRHRMRWGDPQKISEWSDYFDRNGGKETLIEFGYRNWSKVP
jgi:hypothetical protein